MACSDDGGSGSDPDASASVDAGVDAAGPFEVAAAAPAAPPVLLPCPEGWREVTVEDDPTTCEPWPEGGWQDCPAGEAHFPGEPGCAPLGAPCPKGAWPEGLPAEGVLYVSPNGAVDGDGSRGAPFSTIGDALRAAGSGDTVAIAKGTYPEVLTTRRPVTLVGACVAETRIEGGPYGGDSRISVGALRPGLVVRDLSLGSTLWVSSDGGAEVHGVAIEGAVGGGLQVEGPLVATDLVVRGTHEIPDGRFGSGIVVAPGGDLVLDRALVLENHARGVVVEEGSAALESVAIRGTLEEVATGQLGRGAQVMSGGSLSIGSSVIEDNLDMGVEADDDGTSIRVSDSVIRRTRGNEDGGHFGRGVGVEQGASGTLQRVLVEDNREFGVAAQHSGTELLVEDAVVRDTLGEEALGWWGYGVYVLDGAHGRLDRVLSARNTGVGLFVALGGSLEGADLAVREIRPPEDEDAEFAQGSSGLGLQGATADVTRVTVERIAGVPVFLNAEGQTPSDAHIADLVVTDSGSVPSTGDYGRSVDVENGSTVQMERVRIEHGREGGIFAIGAGSRAILRDLVIGDILDAECVARGCMGGGGMGLSSSDGATIEVTSFRIARASLCGIQVAGGEMDLHEGEVTDNPIGANIQDESFDIARLQDGVRYVRNERQLDSVVLPVPRPILPLP